MKCVKLPITRPLRTTMKGGHVGLKNMSWEHINPQESRTGAASHITVLLLMGALWLASQPEIVCGQGEDWIKYDEAGTKAFERGNYVEAEKQLKAAVREAEQFGQKDRRLAICL